MRSLLSTVHNRQLRLVEYLNRYKSGASIDTLTKVLDCSKRLLREDITDINKNLDYLTIISEKGYVYLQYHQNKNISSVVQYMFNNTSGFQILELIFNNENLMTADLAKFNGVSTPTIYRTINKINEVLKKDYDIIVTQNPYRLSGNEREIRNFYTQFFIEKYLAYPWPFPDLDELKFEAFFKDIFTQPISIFSFSEFRFIKISAAVSYIRYMNGHSVSFDGIQLNEYFVRKISGISPSRIDDHEHFFNTAINMSFIRQLFHPFVTDGFYIEYKDLIDGALTNPLTKKSANFIRDLLHTLTEEFHLSVPDEERLILELHDKCYLGQNSNYRTYIIRPHSIGLLETIKQMNPEFYRRTVEEVEKYMLHVWEAYNKPAVNSAVYTLIASWKNLYGELQLRKKTVTVLICSIVGNFQAEMIKEYIKYEFKDQLSIDIYSGVHFRINQIEKMEYDICITDFSVENTGNQRCICFNDIPSNDDLVMLRPLIEEVQYEHL